MGFPGFLRSSVRARARRWHARWRRSDSARSRRGRGDHRSCGRSGQRPVRAPSLSALLAERLPPSLRGLSAGRVRAGPKRQRRVPGARAGPGRRGAGVRIGGNDCARPPYRPLAQHDQVGLRLSGLEHRGRRRDDRHRGCLQRPARRERPEQVQRGIRPAGGEPHGGQPDRWTLPAGDERELGPRDQPRHRVGPRDRPRREHPARRGEQQQPREPARGRELRGRARDLRIEQLGLRPSSRRRAPTTPTSPRRV